MSLWSFIKMKLHSKTNYLCLLNNRLSQMENKDLWFILLMSSLTLDVVIWSVISKIKTPKKLFKGLISAMSFLITTPVKRRTKKESGIIFLFSWIDRVIFVHCWIMFDKVRNKVDKQSYRKSTKTSLSSSSRLWEIIPVKLLKGQTRHHQV